MKMTKEYFDKHATLALQFKCRDGGKFWEYKTAEMAEDHIKYMELERGCYLQTAEFEVEQKDEYVAAFLLKVATEIKPLNPRVDFPTLVGRCLAQEIEVG